MKAALLKEHGTPDKLVYTDFDTPSILPNEVLVRVQATSVNQADLVIRKGYPGLTIPLPHIPGGDIAGVVEEVGSNVTQWKKGDRVVSYPIALENGYTGDDYYGVGWQYFGMHRKGAYAEYVNVPDHCLINLPAHVDFEHAATLPVSALTAEHALNIDGVSEGQTFFFWGGTGGMGTLLIQLAKRRGACVITTASTPEKKLILESLGTDYVFDHTRDDVVAEVMKLAPKGVDVVLDYVGPNTFQQSFDMIRKGGKILWCGMLTGREVTVNIQLTYLKHVGIQGLYLGTMKEMRTLVGYLSDGSLKPYIYAELPLHDASKAHELMESHERVGKIILIP